jgi:dolichol-phosphate mannosyltransferase
MRNEEHNVVPLCEQVRAVLDRTGRRFEIVLVDDGSTDSTFDVIESVARNAPCIRYLKFDRNYGQTAAFDAGFRRARGDVIVMMDGDLQNDPEDIPRLLNELADCDMVCGYRQRRRDSGLRRLASRIANAVRNALTGETVRDVGCSLRAFRREWVGRVKLYEGGHRFFPTYFRLEGARIKEVPVTHHPRLRDKGKYGIWNRLWRATADLLMIWWMQRRYLRYRIERSSDDAR